MACFHHRQQLLAWDLPERGTLDDRSHRLLDVYDPGARNRIDSAVEKYRRQGSTRSESDDKRIRPAALDQPIEGVVQECRAAEGDYVSLGQNLPGSSRRFVTRSHVPLEHPAKLCFFSNP